MGYGQTHLINTQVRTTTTTTRLRQVCDLLFLCRDFMADSSGQPSGAARRRRERRLRSMLRHEQQTVRMALAAALHHSAGPVVEKVELQQHAALRGQKTGTRAGEGEVHVKYDAPRRQNAPHPGERRVRVVSLTPGRSGVTAPCGTPRGTLLSWWCRRCAATTASMAPPSDSSSSRTCR